MQLSNTRIKRELRGAPIRVGDRTLHPAARLDGWVLPLAFDRSTSEWRARLGWLRITPVAVEVREPDGQISILTIYDPVRARLRLMFLAAFLITGVFWLWFSTRRYNQ
jgi:hypothetical protein